MPNRMKYTEDMFLNKKFGRLFITGPVEKVMNSKGFVSKRIVYADCDCGKKHVPVNVIGLMRGEVKSCGCLGKENLNKLGEGRHNGTIQSSGNTKHGDSKNYSEYHRLYMTWQNMRSRCKYESCDNYKWYGGRGIKVCEEWDNSYEAFKTWALSHGWSPELEIDRINSDGNYEPSNCRWITHYDQVNNQSRNIPVTLYGTTMNISQWADCIGFNASSARARISKGSSPEDVVNSYINPNAEIQKPFIFINMDEVRNKYGY